MGNQPWPQFQNGIRERSIEVQSNLHKFIGQFLTGQKGSPFVRMSSGLASSPYRKKIGENFRSIKSEGLSIPTDQTLNPDCFSRVNWR